MSFSFSASTQEVLEQVVREPRFRALTKLPLFAPMEIGLGFAAFGLFGGRHLALSLWACAFLSNARDKFFRCLCLFYASA